jgi:alkylation response protein AidB-like acyl-CoA dehydrogenase
MRDLYDHDHKLFRESFEAFLRSHVESEYPEWERQGTTPREAFLAAGEAGFLGIEVPGAYGGSEVDDYRFNTVMLEAMGAGGYGALSAGLSMHNDICVPYFLSYADESQRERWLPGLVSGELPAGLAMTEPGTGSDLASIATVAERKGDHFVVNGGKTFITNGQNANLLITAVKTDRKAGRAGLSLLVVEDGTEGFKRGRNLEKLGMHSQDTAELFFDDALVPAANLLGEEGSGFGYLLHNLARERLSIAVAGVAAARAALDWTTEYVRSRNAFGQAIGAFQNTRFVLAEVATEVEVTQAFIDRCIAEINRGRLTAEEAAMAKWWCTDLQGRAIDRCLQLHGGYGYMSEYPISRAYADARVTRIYGGTNEIMKEIIGRSLGLAGQGRGGSPAPAPARVQSPNGN